MIQPDQWRDILHETILFGMLFKALARLGGKIHSQKTTDGFLYSVVVTVRGRQEECIYNVSHLKAQCQVRLNNYLYNAKQQAHGRAQYVQRDCSSELQKVKVTLNHGKKYTTEIDKATIEDYLKVNLAETKTDKDKWRNDIVNKFFTKEERAKYIEKFVKAE